jgi:hypothetical protein
MGFASASCLGKIYHRLGISTLSFYIVSHALAHASIIEMRGQIYRFRHLSPDFYLCPRIPGIPIADVDQAPRQENPLG